jgi:hypothetical protein
VKIWFKRLRKRRHQIHKSLDSYIFKAFEKVYITYLVPIYIVHFANVSKVFLGIINCSVDMSGATSANSFGILVEGLRSLISTNGDVPGARNKFLTISKYTKDKILLHRHYHCLWDYIIAKFAIFNRRKFENL